MKQEKEASSGRGRPGVGNKGRGWELREWSQHTSVGKPGGERTKGLGS